jgi:hypothetical protein
MTRRERGDVSDVGRILGGVPGGFGACGEAGVTGDVTRRRLLRRGEREDAEAGGGAEAWSRRRIRKINGINGVRLR